tara:strand:- start:7 stop:291 length:285 start_codon:yes stop_codon:yes gene_type:complete
MKNKKFRIEIYYPDNKNLSSKSKIISEGTTLRDFLTEIKFDDFNQVSKPAFGVFGNIKGLDYVLREFDRVEVYHEASKDPKKSRVEQAKKDHKP